MMKNIQTRAESDEFKKKNLIFFSKREFMIVYLTNHD